jgi:hypothetical protein
MKKIIIRGFLMLLTLFVAVSIMVLPSLQETKTIRHPSTNKIFNLYPNTYDVSPEFPSPYTLKDGTEIVLAFTLDKKYALFPVTVENGEPLDYRNGQWWSKGRQLEVDDTDFPTLARTGLHSEKELDKTRTITGRSVEEITEIGRPDRYSGVGFMSQDEDIISVLRGDNRLVKKLNLTHPQMAEPLFHVFNIILAVKKDSERGNIKGLQYNQRKISLKFWGHKGWQDSIFNDEILGYWEIEMSRELDQKEKDFLLREYPDLTEEEMARLIKKLSDIHTAEMAPYYIMRYGFYEGHTDYRADPIAIAFIFGLRSLDEIESVFKGKLYKILMNLKHRD